jgi:DNA-binding winged helix-turn-helix (wHTH) protein/TolB-like protein/cytochrome c-type biogenesis protein CcmH/NrfG
MSGENGHFREFGGFLLDVEKRVLWFEGAPVNLHLKEIEVLCVLTEAAGQVVTKDELLDRVWADSFVEESNLSRHIYLLRKTFKDHGKSEELIQTVPRRGYRFTGDVKAASDAELIIEKHSLTRTLIEDVSVETATRPLLVGRRMFAAPLIAVGLLTVMLGGYALWRYNTTGAARIGSIAVLPLRSMDDNADDRALSFGLADSLIRNLGRVSDVRVISASAISQYKDPQKDSADIGRDFGVDAVLDGTLQRSNGKLRVTLRLVRVSDGVQLWSGLFNESETEIFRLQESIASQTGQALAVNLKPREGERRPTDNLDAYHAFLRADYLLRLRSHDASRSIPFFRQAVELDPNFARAWAGLAAVLAMGLDIDEAEAALDKALALDPELAEAHATRGFIRMFNYWDWNEAEKSLRRAVELDPNSVQGHHWLGVYLSIRGRLDEAKAEMRRALELDPLSLNITTDLGQVHYFAREYPVAEEYCLKALSIDPNYHFAHTYLWPIYLKQGRTAEVFEYYARAQCSQPDEKARTQCRDAYAGLYEREGLRGVFESGIDQYLTTLARNEVSADNIGQVYNSLGGHSLLLGDEDTSIKYFNRSLETKAKYGHVNFVFPYMNVDPQFDALRDDPRFQAILEKINLNN